jgi:Mg/Co/Ni transporter MgtE
VLIVAALVPVVVVPAALVEAPVAAVLVVPIPELLVLVAPQALNAAAITRMEIGLSERPRLAPFVCCIGNCSPLPVVSGPGGTAGAANATKGVRTPCRVFHNHTAEGD